MSSPLKERLTADVKAAMKGGDKPRVAALRLLTAALKQQEIDTRTDLDDDAVTAILTRLAKQRRESIEQFVAGGREDLAEQERFELKIIDNYLPEPLGDAEIEQAIDAAIAESGASGPADMGKVMGILKRSLQGRVQMGEVSARVKSRLA